MPKKKKKKKILNGQSKMCKAHDMVLDMYWHSVTGCVSHECFVKEIEHIPN